MTDFNSTRAVKARKPHICETCGRTIARGERYRRCTGRLDERFYSEPRCTHCVAAYRIAGTIAPSWWELIEWDDLPLEAADLTDRARAWRLVAGIYRQWTRKDGALMEVPA